MSVGNYLAGDVPDGAKWEDCVHCGLCLEACPTYIETGHEHQSPRGRVYLIKAVAEGKVALDESFLEPVFTCLDCRACETACPSNVQVGNLIEVARGQVRQAVPLTGLKGLLQKFFLNGIFPYPSRLHALGSLFKFYQKSGLQKLARKMKVLHILPPHLREMELVTPDVSQPVRKKYQSIIPVSHGQTKQRVGMLAGCVMDVFFSDVNDSTIRVLTRNGYEVFIPEEQRCCGALHVHAGDRETGKKLARQNIDAFASVDTVIVNAAGCGCAMQEYDDLLKNDATYREKAAQFVKKVVDVSKFLHDNGYEKPTGHLSMRVTYHDACHLAHGQNVREEPRQLLKDIPGIEWVELPNADRCCGSAGIYNITHPKMAGAVLERKMADIPEDVEVISMGNPGCMLQMAAGVKRYGRRETIVHTVELLDRSYRIQDRNERVSLNEVMDRV